MEYSRTANPALNKNTFIGFHPSSEYMTIEGTVNKTFLLLLLLSITSVYSWNLFITGSFESFKPYFYGAMILGLIVAFVTIFKKEWAPITAPIYALLEGLI